jgi:L-ascorbate metabolism protein UlaG (beta-lactamase superfamily)
MALRVEFLGHAACLVELDGVTVLTDPAVRDRIGPLRRVVPGPDRETLRRADVVVISHLHWDHLDLPSLKLLPRTMPIVVPAGAGTWLSGHGFHDVREAAAGDALPFGDVTIEVVPALHSGFRPPRGPTADAVGYVLRGSRSLYFAGDTARFDEMADHTGDLDLALLPVWGWGPTLGRGLHMDPQEAAESLRLLRPRAAMPIHWGTYWPHAMGRVRPELLVEPPAAFAEHAAETMPRVRILLPEVGETVAWPR